MRRKYEGQRAQIIEVVDGDTVKVRLTKTNQTVTIRLIGIDTPETKEPGVAVECGGPQATWTMNALSFPKPPNPYAVPPYPGRFVVLDTDESQDVKDGVGRVLAYLDTEENRVDLGHLMVAVGWAQSYVFNKGFQRLAAYKASEAKAEGADAGVWKLCNGDFHSQQ